MKPHPRIRETVKWGGAVVTVLLVVVWIGSGWWTWRGLQMRSLEVMAGRGRIYFTVYDEVPITGTANGLIRGIGNQSCPLRPFGIELLRPFGIELWFDSAKLPGLLSWAGLPLWLPATAVGVPTMFAWRLDTLARRRARLNLCLKCNYDRTGLAVGAVCPECGGKASVAS